MKNLIIGVMTLCLANAALAADSKEDLDNRIRKLTAKFETMQAKPDKKIPADVLHKAHGIVLLDRTKAGFIFAFQGGSGVAMVRDAKTQKWSAPAFVGAKEASLGFQIGGQQSFLAILLMDTNALQMLTNPDFEFGGEARGTAGNSSTGAQANIKGEQSVMVFDDRKGLYGGAALKAGAVTVDQDDNNVYYGQYASIEDIVFKNKFQPSQAAKELADKIDQAAKSASAK